MNDLMFDIVLKVLSVLFVAISTLLIPYVKAKWDVSKWNKYLAMADLAVGAAEQLYNVAGGKGFDRKEFAIRTLERLGVKLTVTQMDALIESAVFNLNLSLKGDELNAGNSTEKASTKSEQL